MILRVWRGRAAPAKAETYAEHFRRNLAAELRAIEGFLGASLFRQDRPDTVEFLVLTRWRSWEAIRAFAGDDVGKAVVEPGAIAALVDYDDHVQHFRLVDELPPNGAAAIE